jgi:hypothetical protein
LSTTVGPRAYPSSTLVRDRDDELTIFCKAWCVANTTGRYPKTEFRIDFAHERPTCPNNVTDGRAVLRQRTTVEHHLAHIGHWQGHRARLATTRPTL